MNVDPFVSNGVDPKHLCTSSQMAPRQDFSSHISGYVFLWVAMLLPLKKLYGFAVTCSCALYKLAMVVLCDIVLALS